MLATASRTLETATSLLDAGARFVTAVRELANRHDLGDDDCTPALAEVLDVLAEQPEWRVFVDGTRNLGHQASTVRVLRRLIDLMSFSGRVVIVYADLGHAAFGATAQKLALLFAGIDPLHLDDAVATYRTCRTIRFLPFERRAELTEPCAFGFTGGADDMMLNCARELNVRFFVRLQPYLWDDMPAARYDEYYESSRIEQPDGRHLYLLESCPDLNALPIKGGSSRAATDVAPEIWRWYANEQGFDAGLACRTRNVRSVLTLCDDRDEGALLWPVYGLQHFKNEAAGMLLVCALVACRCAKALQRSIVLCSFSPAQELQGWSEALAADLQLAQPDLPVGVELWRTYLPAEREWTALSPEMERALARHGAPSVHIVELGLVPFDIFEHCVARADLPSVIEGQATSNFLTVLGKPFLQVLRSEHVIKNGYAMLAGNDFTREMAAAMTFFAMELQQLVPTRWHASRPTAEPQEYCARLDRLAQLLVDAQCASSAVARYFALLGRHFRHNKHDKVMAALLALREVMLASADCASP